MQLLTALYAFRLEREPLDVLWVFPAQQVVYRQLMYSVLIRSVASAVQRCRGALAADEPHRRARTTCCRNRSPPHWPALLSTTTPRRWPLLSGNELQRRRASRSTCDTAPVAAVTGRERWLGPPEGGGAGSA